MIIMEEGGPPLPMDPYKYMDRTVDEAVVSGRFNPAPTIRTRDHVIRQWAVGKAGLTIPRHAQQERQTILEWTVQPWHYKASTEKQIRRHEIKNQLYNLPRKHLHL